MDRRETGNPVENSMRMNPKTMVVLTPMIYFELYFAERKVQAKEIDWSRTGLGADEGGNGPNGGWGEESPSADWRLKGKATF